MAFWIPKRKTAAMESNNIAVNGEVAIDFKGDGIYNQRHAPHSSTLGHHSPWRSCNMENKMPEETVRFYFFCFFFLYFAIDLQFKTIYEINFEKFDTSLPDIKNHVHHFFTASPSVT